MTLRTEMFRFCSSQVDEIEDLLKPKHKKSVKVKMVIDEEDFYYHVVPQDIAENLLRRDAGLDRGR